MNWRYGDILSIQMGGIEAGGPGRALRSECGQSKIDRVSVQVSMDSGKVDRKEDGSRIGSWIDLP
jgi:hypothetical protein